MSISLFVLRLVWMCLVFLRPRAALCCIDFPGIDFLLCCIYFSDLNMKRFGGEIDSCVSKKKKNEESPSLLLNLNPLSSQPCVLQEKKNNSRGFPLTDVPLHHFDLGKNLFLVVSDFTGEVRVHLRMYHRNGELMTPTTRGVTFSPLCLLKMNESIDSMKTFQPKTFTFHDELFVSLRQDRQKYLIQKLFRDKTPGYKLIPGVVEADHTQMKELQDMLPKAIESSKALLFGRSFRQAVSRQCTVSSEAGGEEEALDLMVKSLHFEVITNIGELFECPECLYPCTDWEVAPRSHRCAQISEADKKIGNSW